MANLVGLFVCLAVFCCAISSGERVRYDNYHTYSLQPTTRTQLAVLKRMDGAHRDMYIFLDGVHSVGAEIIVLVAPQQVPDFVKTVERAHISYKLLLRNAQAMLDEDIEPVADPKRRTMDYTWTEYHELDDTYSWLHSLAENYTENVSTFVAGETYEGRDIMGVKISFGAGKKIIFLEAGIHAREWISPAAVTYITNELLTSTDKEVRMIAESFDWYIVPHANPDGYVYTHTDDRLWRKTRAPYEDCFGVDPNRNWGFHWNEIGASDNPCSDTYAGPSAFSEIETRSLSEFISTLKGNIHMYVAFHSYSQLLLFPYGHTNELPPNYDDLLRVFNAGVDAIAQRYGTKYTGGNIYDAIYPAAGASCDWAYGDVDVQYAYTFELRPGRFSLLTGFRLPAEQIIPTSEETLDSLMAMIKEAGIVRFL